mmetsp:Transcript_8508/g.35502  ORF Transcript_8508/g.35502 Transcript_8508/m.35502 type:complete len:379 (+) Transcript_8508:87-1223(+)
MSGAGEGQELRKRGRQVDEEFDSLTDSSGSEGETQGRTQPRRRAQTADSFLGLSLRFWLLVVVLVCAVFVLGLCVVGEMKQFDGSYWKASEIVPNVWLGGYKDQLNRSALLSRGVTHILTVAIGVEPVYPNDFQYLVIRAHDHNSQDLISYFPQAHAFIDEALAGGGAVLVHCMAGVSRSATLVTSYVMREKNWNPFEALDHVKNQRSRAKPRTTFREQLEAYHYFRRDYSNPELAEYVKRFPNKAQVALWPAPDRLFTAKKAESKFGQKETSPMQQRRRDSADDSRLEVIDDDRSVVSDNPTAEGGHSNDEWQETSGAQVLGIGLAEQVLESREPIRYFAQPVWVEEDGWKELWDATVHHFLHFFNKYLRFYVKKRN